MRKTIRKLWSPFLTSWSQKRTKGGCKICLSFTVSPNWRFVNSITTQIWAGRCIKQSKKSMRRLREGTLDSHSYTFQISKTGCSRKCFFNILALWKKNIFKNKKRALKTSQKAVITHTLSSCRMKERWNRTSHFTNKTKTSWVQRSNGRWSVLRAQQTSSGRNTAKTKHSSTTSTQCS